MFKLRQWGRSLIRSRRSRSNQDAAAREHFATACENQINLGFVDSTGELDKAVKDQSDNRIAQAQENENIRATICRCPSCSHHRSGGPCKCENCQILLNLVECGICMIKLQNQKIRSCSICANFVCEPCMRQLKHCAFCRAEHCYRKNPALERLFNKFTLPDDYEENYSSSVDTTPRSSITGRNQATILWPIKIKTPPTKELAEIKDLDSYFKLFDVLRIKKNDIKFNLNFTLNGSKDKSLSLCMVNRDRVFMVVIKLQQTALGMKFFELENLNSVNEENIFVVKVNVQRSKVKLVNDQLVFNGVNKGYQIEFNFFPDDSCNYMEFYLRLDSFDRSKN